MWLRTDKGIIYAPITTLVWNGQRMMLECAAKQYRETDKPENMSNGDILEYSNGAVSRTPQDVLFDRLKGSTPGLNLKDGAISMDASFRHDGQTVSVANYYYNGSADTDETGLESWLDTQLATMTDMSVREVAVRSKPVGGSVFYCRLCRHNSNYAVLQGCTYDNKIVIKSRASGTWQASKTQTIGG